MADYDGSGAVDTSITFDPNFYGNGGDDLAYGNANPNQVYGGAGNDILLGGQVASSTGTGTANDPYLYTVQAPSGDDIIEGGDGIDLVEGGDGNDKMYGGEGNDAGAFTS